MKSIGTSIKPPPPPSDRWEVALAPLNVRIETSPNETPHVVLVASGDVVLHVEVLERPPAAVRDAARLVATAIAGARAATGQSPREVVVSDHAIVEELRTSGALGRIVVGAADVVPGAALAIAGLKQTIEAAGDMLGDERVERRETWREWSLPNDLVRRLHAAAAAYHRAAPWKRIADDEALSISDTVGALGTLVVLGNAGLEPGLALYQLASDYLAILTQQGELPRMPTAEGLVVSIVYNRRQDVSTLRVRETLAGRWEIAGHEAWPELMTQGPQRMNPPVRWVDALARALEALPRFSSHHRARARMGQGASASLPWEDLVTGLRFEAAALPAGGLPSPWEPQTALTPCLPSGPGARHAHERPLPFAFQVNADCTRILGGYTRSLARDDRTSDALRLRRIDIASAFLSFLEALHTLPSQVNEFHLRRFVFGFWPAGLRRSTPDAEVLALLPALRSLLAFVQKSERVKFPFARPVLAERTPLLERWYTVPADRQSDEAADWQDVLDEDLTGRALVIVDTESLGMEPPPGAVPVQDDVMRLMHANALRFRDEAIAGGVTSPGPVAVHVRSALTVWIDEPHDALGGRSPRAVMGEPVAPRPRASRSAGKPRGGSAAP